MPFLPGRYKTRPAGSSSRRKTGRSGHAGLVQSGSRPSKASALRRAKPTPLMSSVVTKVVNRMAETKYVAQDLAMANYVLGTLDGQAPQSRLMSLMPNIGVGVGSINRIGQKISPTKMLVHVDYTFDNHFDGNFDGFIKQVVVSAKKWKSKDALTNTQQVTSLLPYLINNGDDTTSQISPGNDFHQLSYPYESEQLTKLKGDKILHIRKNAGIINTTNNTAPLTTGPSVLRVTIPVKCPKVIQYDTDFQAPTNFLPLFACLGAVASEGLTYNTLIGPLLPGSIPTLPCLRYNVRVEMWFKDL